MQLNARLRPAFVATRPARAYRLAEGRARKAALALANDPDSKAFASHVALIETGRRLGAAAYDLTETAYKCKPGVTCELDNMSREFYDLSAALDCLPHLHPAAATARLTITLDFCKMERRLREIRAEVAGAGSAPTAEPAPAPTGGPAAPAGAGNGSADDEQAAQDASDAERAEQHREEARRIAASLTPEEVTVFLSLSNSGTLRAFLGKEERRVVRSLIKKGAAERGVMPLGNSCTKGHVFYYSEHHVREAVDTMLKAAKLAEAPVMEPAEIVPANGRNIKTEGWYELLPAEGLTIAKLRKLREANSAGIRFTSIGRALEFAEDMKIPAAWYTIRDWQRIEGERAPIVRGECSLADVDASAVGLFGSAGRTAPKEWGGFILDFRRDDREGGGASRFATVRVLLPREPEHPQGECYLGAEFPYTASSYEQREQAKAYAEAWILSQGAAFRRRVMAKPRE